MSYIERYYQMMDLLDLSADIIRIPGTSACIRNFSFKSSGVCPPGWMGTQEEHTVPGNFSFRYPVIFPDDSPSNAEVILMMHGLNERNWNKHLPGAFHLATETKRPVILFPLSFHMNRGLPDWSDTRKMAVLLAMRKSQYGDLREASVVNFALSDRLTLEPERFVTSGYQSAMDVLDLLSTIRSGRHPFLEKEAGISIFAYSISCMVMQVLMISNPSGILDHARIVLFAGGCLFPDMQGISRYIMDSEAFTVLQDYYRTLYAPQAQKKNIWFEDCELGRAFGMLVSPEQHKEAKKQFSKFHDNLMVAALKNDQVIPAAGIQKAFGSELALSGRLTEWHFPYPYSHENPFPVLNSHLHHAVESGFRSLYDAAADFIFTGRPVQLSGRKADNKAAALAW